MSGSRICAFSEPDEFEAALEETGRAEPFVIGPGRFRARMTWIVLHHLRLSSVEEFLPRIAFVSPPCGMVTVVLPNGQAPFPVYGGVRVGGDAIVTFCPGKGVHERLDGPCHWSDILLPASHLAKYGRAIEGASFALPFGVRQWRPAYEALKRLAALHAAAIRVIEARPRMTTTAEAAHGLEQELTDALIECLSGDCLEPEATASRRHTEIMGQFEALSRAHPNRKLSAAEICAALEVSDRTLRACCEEHLNMSPSRYLRARRMQLARRALRRADPSETTVSRVAQQYGFGEPSRFALLYRAQFGELPSATLKGRLAGHI